MDGQIAVMIDWFQLQMLAEVALAVGTWPLLVGIYLVVGSGASRDGGGTVGRLCRVSLGAATLAALPMLIWLVVLLPPYSVETSFWFAAGLTVVSAVWVGRCLASPARMHGGSRPLAVLRDEEILERVRELSGEMGIEPPTVRVLGSISYRLQISACAGGLYGPTIALVDGVLYRLEQSERDAVIAHELAHIANGSLWWYAAMVPVAAVAASLASVFVPLPVAAAAGVAIYVGWCRAVSWCLEFACDEAAAQSVGHVATAAALKKTYAEYDISKPSIWKRLARVMGSHPPLELQLAAIRRAAPTEVRDAIEVDSGNVVRYRLAAGIVALSWAGLVGLAVLIGRNAAATGIAIGILMCVSLTPTYFLWTANAESIRMEARRFTSRSGTSHWGWFSIIAAVYGFIMVASFDWQLMLMIAFFSWLSYTIFAPVSHWISQLAVDVTAAVAEHDYHRAIGLGEDNLKRVRKDARLHHTVALAQALGGDQSGAIEELHNLSENETVRPLAALSLANVLLDKDPQQSFEIANGVRNMLPGDPLPLVVETRGLRRLGRTEDAAETIGDAMALERETGLVSAVAASIAIDQGDIERAERLVEEAERSAPGDAFCLVAAAELALAKGTKEEAVQAVEKAAEAAGHTPLAFLGGEIARLRAHPLVADCFSEAEELVWVEE